jgi:hypothetical protein
MGVRAVKRCAGSFAAANEPRAAFLEAFPSGGLQAGELFSCKGARLAFQEGGASSPAKRIARRARYHCAVLSAARFRGLIEGEDAGSQTPRLAATKAEHATTGRSLAGWGRAGVE